MSRGQFPRTPMYFPRMKDRAYKRSLVFIVKLDGPTALFVLVRRKDIPKGYGQVDMRALIRASLLGVGVSDA